MFKTKRSKYKSMSDEELTNSFYSSKDKNCLAEIYARYGRLVLGVCIKYLKDGPKAEDMTMHIFETLFSKLANHQVNNFKPWLYMVTKNECFMFLRKEKKQVPIELNLVPEVDEDQKNHILEERNFDLLTKYLNQLKEHQKLCVQLFYLKSKSYGQISQQLNIPVKKVKSHIQNGKRNLKLMLEKENEFTR